MKIIFIPLRLVSFITITVSFIEKSIREGGKNFPTTLMGTHNHPLSLMCFVANKGV
jgi:hypothetical protein